MTITGIDTHVHVLLRDRPMVTDRHARLQQDYLLPELLADMDAHGISHALITAPSIYATDNSLLLEAIAQSGGRLRGTVILDPLEDMATLVRLSSLGICGIRLNWWRKKSLPDIRTYRDLLAKVRELGWHLELFLDGVHMPDVLPVIERSGVKLVLDHFGCPEPVGGVDGAGFRCMLKLVEAGSAWVKLSAPYRLGGGDAASYARALLRHAGPQRLMWGSDWPWGGFEDGQSYGRCLDWLRAWVPDDAQRQIVLRDTAAQLFGFEETLP